MGWLRACRVPLQVPEESGNKKSILGGREHIVNPAKCETHKAKIRNVYFNFTAAKKKKN